MKKRKHRDRLTFAAEKLALQLLFVASGGNVGAAQAPAKDGTMHEINVSFGDRRALLDSVTKLIEKNHKMKPEDDEPDGIQTAREMLNGAGRESGDRGIGAPETASGSLADTDGSS